MDTHKVTEPVTAVALAYEALDGVLRAHAFLDALTAHSPEELREKIRSINASIARSARALDDIVRRIGCSSNVTVAGTAALFAENDVDELVATLRDPPRPASAPCFAENDVDEVVPTLRGLNLPLHATS